MLCSLTRLLTCLAIFALAGSGCAQSAPAVPASGVSGTPEDALLNRIGTLGDEARSFFGQQDYPHAAQRCRESIALIEAQRGGDDQLIEDPLAMLVDIYAAEDSPSELEAAYLRLIPLFIRLHGEDNPGAQGKMIDLVNFYRHHARFEAAIPWLVRLIASKTRSDGAHAPGLELMHLALADSYSMLGRHAEAAAEYQQVITLIGQSGPTHRKYTGIPMMDLAEAYAAEGKRTLATTTAEQAIAILAEGYGSDNPLVCDAHARLDLILGKPAAEMTCHDPDIAGDSIPATPVNPEQSPPTQAGSDMPAQ